MLDYMQQITYAQIPQTEETGKNWIIYLLKNTLCGEFPTFKVTNSDLGVLTIEGDFKYVANTIYEITDGNTTKLVRLTRDSDKFKVNEDFSFMGKITSITIHKITWGYEYDNGIHIFTGKLMQFRIHEDNWTIDITKNNLTSTQMGMSAYFNKSWATVCFDDSNVIFTDTYSNTDYPINVVLSDDEMGFVSTYIKNNYFNLYSGTGIFSTQVPTIAPRYVKSSSVYSSERLVCSSIILTNGYILPKFLDSTDKSKNSYDIDGRSIITFTCTPNNLHTIDMGKLP